MVLNTRKYFVPQIQYFPLRNVTVTVFWRNSECFSKDMYLIVFSIRFYFYGIPTIHSVAGWVGCPVINFLKTTGRE